MVDAPGTRNPIDIRELTADAPGRIDAAVAAACSDLSRARVQRLLAEGFVTVNGAPARKSHQVVAGDRITVELPRVEHDTAASGLELPVLYEDELLVAIDKPAGLAVHGAPGDTGPSVAIWFLERLGDAATGFGVERPGIVHRLDKDTSGVMLLAKTPQAQATLSAAFEARTTKKTYIAICDGVPGRERAIIDAPIHRHPGDRTKMAIAKHGRAARTGYEVLAQDGVHSLLLVQPETGRTHQIRVHLAAINTPVTFDRVYGRGGDGRQLLHAWRLTVPHPGGGTLTVTSPLPDDFAPLVRSMHAEQIALPYSKPVPPERNGDAP